MEDKTTHEANSKPKVSIVIPTQNRIHLLPDIIDCFNQQTWWNKELLILDDTPNGKEAIEELQKQYPNIHLWHIHEICSIGSKRNQLIEKAGDSELIESLILENKQHYEKDPASSDGAGGPKIETKADRAK